MTVVVTEAPSGKGIAIDPNGIFPIPGSRLIRSIDVIALCRKAKAPSPHAPTPAERVGDLVEIFYGEIKHPEKEEQQRCWGVIWFVGTDGQKGAFLYPNEDHTNNITARIGGMQDVLGMDAKKMASVIIEYAPWKD